MCIDVCMRMCMGMCIHTHVYRHVHRHVYRQVFREVGVLFMGVRQTNDQNKRSEYKDIGAQHEGRVPKISTIKRNSMCARTGTRARD